MAKRYKHLLSPVRIGNVVIKNRMMYPNASPHFLQGPETFPAEGYRAFVAQLARNGAGIVTVAEWDNPGQRKIPMADACRMQSFDLTDPSVHNYFSQMADEVHFYGSKLLIGAAPSFPEGYSFDGKPPMGPPVPGAVYKAIPKDMIPGVYGAFIEKLKMYRDIGYDGVAWRMEQFLLPDGNARGDGYSGSVENRTRFVVEACQAIKKAMGPDFIIELTIAGEQPGGYSGGQEGYSFGEALEFVKLVDGSADILQIREKDITQSHPTGFTFKKGQHKVIEYSEKIKAAGCKILTEPIGGFHDPDELEGYIAQGKCDMIGMARAFMCDEEYGKKVYEGRGEDITPCLFCNKCHGTMEPPWLSFCSVNPLMGYEAKIGRMVGEAGSPKKVAVIGGGPAGMRAALYAAQRGHKVTVFEKSDHLGGQLIHGDYSSFKWPVGDFKNWLIAQVGKSPDIEVRMNTAPTPESIEAEGFDAVIAATGAKANIPNIPGLRKEDGSVAYKTCLEVYGHEKELGKSVIIVGGSETGIETAMYLAENGHDVTVLTRQDEIAKDASHLHYITMAYIAPDGRMCAAWEKYDNIRGIVNATTTRVEGGRVTYSAPDGEHTVEADSVVICGGMKPCVEEALEFAGAADSFSIIGDANGAGNLQRCMREAYSRAMML